MANGCPKATPREWIRASLNCPWFESVVDLVLEETRLDQELDSKSSRRVRLRVRVPPLPPDNGENDGRVQERQEVEELKQKPMQQMQQWGIMHDPNWL